MANQAVKVVPDSFMPKFMEMVADSYAPKFAEGELNIKKPTTVTGMAEASETLSRMTVRTIRERNFVQTRMAAEGVIEYMTEIRDWAADREPGGKFGEPSANVPFVNVPGFAQPEGKQRRMGIHIKYAEEQFSALQSAAWDGDKAAAEKHAKSLCGYAQQIPRYV